LKKACVLNDHNGIKLLPGWEATTDDEGEVYFFSLSEEKSTYELGEAAILHTHKGETLLPGWEPVVDGSDVFFYSVETGESTFDLSRATGKRKAEEAAVAAAEALSSDPTADAEASAKSRAVDDLLDLMRARGVLSSQLVVFVDFTKSNLDNGGRNLHDVSSHREQNPYEQVISIVGRTLEAFDSDGQIPLYGFGDKTTKDHNVFALHKSDDELCKGVPGLLQAYREQAPRVQMEGPTCFAPAINKTVEIAARAPTPELHICLIIADGQVSDTRKTLAALAAAAAKPVSVICVGVGDGPFTGMNDLDYSYVGSRGGRSIDNFVFVEFESVRRLAAIQGEPLEESLARECLREMPDFIDAAKRLRLFGAKWTANTFGATLGRAPTRAQLMQRLAAEAQAAADAATAGRTVSDTVLPRLRALGAGEVQLAVYADFSEVPAAVAAAAAAAANELPPPPVPTHAARVTSPLARRAVGAAGAAGTPDSPYELALSVLFRALAPLNGGGDVALHGFGDARGHGGASRGGAESEPFPLLAQGVCRGLADATFTLREAVNDARPLGAAARRLAPLLLSSVELVHDVPARRRVPLVALLLVAGGEHGEAALQRTLTELALASKHQIYFVVVGCGEGPFDGFEQLNDGRQRSFDNLAFVALDDLRARCAKRNPSAGPALLESALGLAMLTRLPRAVERLRQMHVLRK
jgi:E3 ubiquitin-protein ligase RGLG